MPKSPLAGRRDMFLALIFSVLSVVVYLLPTGFEAKVEKNAVRCKGRVLAVDNSQIQQMGMIKAGDQEVTLELLDGPFKGEKVSGGNPLLGRLDRDKIFQPGDTALVVLSLDSKGKILFVNPQDHYRLGAEGFLLAGKTASAIDQTTPLARDRGGNPTRLPGIERILVRAVLAEQKSRTQSMGRSFAAAAFWDEPAIPRDFFQLKAAGETF